MYDVGEYVMLCVDMYHIEVWEDFIGMVVYNDDGDIKVRFSDGTTYYIDYSDDVERYANKKEIAKYNKELRFNKLKQFESNV